MEEATTRSHITEHKKAQHDGVKFYCDQCDFKSSWRSMLFGHVKAVYEGIKYNCDQCDCTAQKRLLIRNKQHIYEETKCDKCEHKRPAKKNLLRHKRYKHEGINDRPCKFVCNH